VATGATSGQIRVRWTCTSTPGDVTVSTGSTLEATQLQ
jgi:hypothetical protein